MMLALKLRLSLLVCIGVLAVPASAAAATCAPPGNSSVSQYLETVPGANCNRGAGPSGPGSGGHHGGGGSLPAGTSSQLAKQGAVGQAVKKLVASSGVGSGTGSGSTDRSGNGAGHAKSSGKSTVLPTANLSGSGSSPVSGLLHPVLTGSSSGGIGVLLPVLLAAALALALVAVVARRRFRSTGPQT